MDERSPSLESPEAPQPARPSFQFSSFGSLGRTILRVHVCLTAPKNMKELEQNLAALHNGPLSEDDMQFMRSFGDAVHAQRKWFM